MGFKNLTFEVRDGLAHLTLNRPKAANAFNLDLAREFLETATICAEDPAIRAVLLTGAGRMFSAGGDLKDFSAA
jgi:2-(1,2-epoxy-1,2-dihydrophenyl)acetyl-CoA isomerase